MSRYAPFPPSISGLQYRWQYGRDPDTSKAIPGGPPRLRWRTPKVHGSCWYRHDEKALRPYGVSVSAYDHRAARTEVFNFSTFE